MTTPLIPDFVINMFENEIRGIIKQVIDVGVEHFGVDENEFKKRVEKKVGMKLTLVTEDTEIVRILKTKPRKLPADEDRCLARVLKCGMYDRCKFHKHEDNDHVCKKHMKCTKYGLIIDQETSAPPGDNPLKKYSKIY